MPWYEVVVNTRDEFGTAHSHRRQLQATSAEEAERLARRYDESDGVTVLSTQSMGEIAEPGAVEPEGAGERAVE